VASALAIASTAAVRTLAAIMINGDVAATVRVSAARAILAVGPTWMDHAVLNARVASIEQALARSTRLRSAS
jgi:hypothetical protein